MEIHLKLLLHFCLGEHKKHANLGSTGANIQISTERLDIFYCSPLRSDHLTVEINCSGGEGAGLTFAGGGATVIFEMRAVLALVVFGAVAVVVGGQVEAGCSVLTRVGRTVIDIQLGGGGGGVVGGRGKKKEKKKKRKADKFDS